jgi:hypothetical protein
VAEKGGMTSSERVQFPVIAEKNMPFILLTKLVQLRTTSDYHWGAHIYAEK